MVGDNQHKATVQIVQMSQREMYLHVRCGEYARSSMMFSFKPVGIYLPVDVNNVAFLQHELSDERKKNKETRIRNIN